MTPPLPHENEVYHEPFALTFIERHMTAHLNGRFPAWSSFIPLKLSGVRNGGLRLPDFALIRIARSRAARNEVFFHGFELKVPSGVALKAVEQASDQLKFFHSISLLLHLPQGWPGEQFLPEIIRIAASKSIGVVRVKEWQSSPSYEILVEAPIKKPIEDARHYLISHLSEPQKRRLHSWCNSTDG
jgi:hypothetical protein